MSFSSALKDHFATFAISRLSSSTVTTLTVLKVMTPFLSMKKSAGVPVTP